MGVADIDEGRVREVVGGDLGEPRLRPRRAIRGPGALRPLRAAQDQHVDHAAPADLARRLRIARRRPQPRMRLLPRSRPDVDVPVRVVLALPAERPRLMRQRLPDEIDRLPVAFDVVDRVRVARRHLGTARLDEADLQAPAGDDVRRGVLFRHPHRIVPQRDQRPHAQDADVPRLAGQDAEDQRVGPEEGVDPGMVLDGDDVQPVVVAQHELVQHLLEQVGGDPRIAVLVRQAGADGIRAVEDLLRNEGIGVLALVPGVHGPLPSSSKLIRSGRYRSRKAATRSTKASGCSISGWWPASAMSSKRAPGINAL